MDMDRREFLRLSAAAASGMLAPLSISGASAGTRCIVDLWMCPSELWRQASDARHVQVLWVSQEIEALYQARTGQGPSRRYRRNVAIEPNRSGWRHITYVRDDRTGMTIEEWIGAHAKELKCQSVCDKKASFDESAVRHLHFLGRGRAAQGEDVRRRCEQHLFR